MAWWILMSKMASKNWNKWIKCHRYQYHFFCAWLFSKRLILQWINYIIQSWWIINSGASLIKCALISIIDGFDRIISIAYIHTHTHAHADIMIEEMSTTVFCRLGWSCSQTEICIIVLSKSNPDRWSSWRYETATAAYLPLLLLLLLLLGLNKCDGSLLKQSG